MSGEVQPLPASRPIKGAPLVESEVMAMLIFVVTEVMLFAGFLSGYNIVGARAPAGLWPPPGDPALPVLQTGIATAALLASGVAVWWGGRASLKSAASAIRPLWVGFGLAAVFVIYQVVEFARLVGVGFTLQSSAHGGFFYTIVGAHALHAVVALAVLAWSAKSLGRGSLTPQMFTAVRIFWYFVVGLWPALFAVVYL